MLHGSLVFAGIVVVALVAGGCTGRSTRLRDERSELLEQRHTLQGSDTPAGARNARSLKSGTRKNPIDPTLPPEEKVQEIDKRVAEIDAELLRYN